MTKEELVKLLEKTLHDIPDEIDGVYRVGELYSNLSGLGVERFEALRKLYDLTLYVELLNGDFVVLFHQFLSSSLIYERKYAMAKLYPLMNEGFKHLYGFVNEKTGQVKILPESKWNNLEEIESLMTPDEKAIYQELLAMLEEDAAFSWWKEERDNETHMDAVGVYNHRTAQGNENKSIQDAMSFYRFLTKTTALCSKMTRRLCGPITSK